MKRRVRKRGKTCGCRVGSTRGVKSKCGKEVVTQKTARVGMKVGRCVGNEIVNRGEIVSVGGSEDNQGRSKPGMRIRATGEKHAYSFLFNEGVVKL